MIGHGDRCSFVSLPIPPPPHLQNLIVTVKKSPKRFTPNSVNITSWPIIGSANMATPSLFQIITLFYFSAYVSTIGMVDLAPILMVHYKGYHHVGSTNPFGTQ
jgi:hypothetical protein